MSNELMIGVYASAIVAVLAALYPKVKRALRKQFYFKIFGGSVVDDESLNLIYGEFVLNPGLIYPPGVRPPYAYVKSIPTPNAAANIFSISHPVSMSEVRAIGYITRKLGGELKIRLDINSDVVTNTTTDLNYIAFGGPGSNIKSHDAIFHPDNGLVRFDNARMWEVVSGKILFNGPTQTHDYGLILKIRPSEHQNRDRSWVVCAGFGEWGTSGAARYLADNWFRLTLKYGSKSFAVIVLVEHTKDDSGKEVYATEGQ